VNPYYGRHFVTTEWDRRMPLYLTSVGWTDYQSSIDRQNGFHDYHWLHTIEGSGHFTVNGSTVKLSPNEGLLLKPGVPHSYRPDENGWSTWFLTFDGALAGSIFTALDMPHAQLLRWEADCPLASIHEEYAEKCRYSFDFAGVSGSQEVYTFLSQLKQFGQAGSRPSLSQGRERLTPVYLLIEQAYGDPNLGLDRLAGALHISPQHLNTLFRKSWGVSPYQYLLQFRIQKSKELLIQNRARGVKEIAAAVGFRDYSHFVHTFHKLANMTPQQFRQQYS